METGKYLKLNLMGENDDADILKVTENFQKIEDMAPGWTNFSNSGTVLETEGDFQIATSFPVPEGQDGIFSITVKMPRAYAEEDTITVGGVAYNLYQGTDPALADAWKAGEVVTINFDKTSRRCWASAGGGAPRPIPAQVSNMNASVPEGETPQVLFTWTNPVDENFAGMVLVVKAGSAPNGVTDGTQAYKGTGTSFTYADGVQWGVTYYGRGFAYNSQNKFQMDATGAIASAKPTNTAPPVTEFKATIEKGSDTAVLTWKKPVSSFYAGVKIVRKPSIAPTGPADGDEVYNGNGETYSDTGLLNGVEYFYTAYSYNSAGEYTLSPAPGDTVTPNVIPEKWGLLQCITDSTTWTVPKDGFYRVHVFGKCGDGGDGESPKNEDGLPSDASAGAGGASGGYAQSILQLHGEEKIYCTVNTSISSFGEHLSATAAVGTRAGTASGGTEHTLNGYPGGSGEGQNRGAHEGAVGQGYLGGSPGGGGGARLPSPELGFPYIPDDLYEYSGGEGGGFTTSGGTYNGNPGSSYPTFNPQAPRLYGGGNGGGGAGGYYSSNYDRTYYSKGGAGSKGSPACIIIEKGIYS